jgi:RNA polymerase sigma factor for flagellar operon FliA
LVTCHLMSLDATTQQIADTSEDSPEEQVLKNERRTALRRAMDQLPAKKKQVLEDYYYRGMSLDEIGKGLGLSRSRVCRIHAKTLEQVREIMQQSAASGPRVPPLDNAGSSDSAPAKMRMAEAGRRPVKQGGQLSGARYDNPIVKP